MSVFPRSTVPTAARLLLCSVLFTGLGGIGQACATSLPRATPEEEGFSSAGLAKVDALIQDAVDKGFPGAVLAVVRNGKLVKLTAYGYAKRNDEHGALADPQPMRTDTLFDLASNTKMYATTFAMQRLVYEGKVDLAAPVQRYLPEFVDGPDDPIKGKAGVTVAQLLHHTSGALANPLYYDRKAMGALFSQDRRTTYEKLVQTPLAFPPDTRNVYSDLGFMLLGMIIERVSGQPLEDYVEQSFYAPLGIRALYAPLRGNARLHGFKPQDFAATETHGNTRDGSIDFENIRT
ncbi:MAG: serine hydrolase, partial [Pseudoxanthomonas sp.]